MEKLYLGDGVYIKDGSSNGSFVLTTENGISVTNEIYFEPEVVQELKEVLKRFF